MKRLTFAILPEVRLRAFIRRARVCVREREGCYKVELTEDSKKLQHGCRMNYAGFPSFCYLGLKDCRVQGRLMEGGPILEPGEALASHGARVPYWSLLEVAPQATSNFLGYVQPGNNSNVGAVRAREVGINKR